MSNTLTNEPERRYSWPESPEKRTLRCNLLESERRDYGHEQSELIQEVDQLEEQKKASASHYKALIEEKGARARRIAGYITSGWREKDVQCEWYYECSGIDSVTGDRIYHPEKKALVRLDKFEVVEVRDITSDERQMCLLPDEPQQDDQGELPLSDEPANEAPAENVIHAEEQPAEAEIDGESPGHTESEDTPGEGGFSSAATVVEESPAPQKAKRSPRQPRKA